MLVSRWIVVTLQRHTSRLCAFHAWKSTCAPAIASPSANRASSAGSSFGACDFADARGDPGDVAPVARQGGNQRFYHHVLHAAIGLCGTNAHGTHQPVG